MPETGEVKDRVRAMDYLLWRERADANRQALLDMGLWGVPSFRYGDQVTWGQDRLFWVEAMLTRGRQ